jgi:thymidylate synthase (FAD)
MDPHAQWEVREYAQAIAHVVADWLPLTWEAFLDYRLRAATLSRAEVEALRMALQPDTVELVCGLAAARGSSAREVAALRALLEGPC